MEYHLVKDSRAFSIRSDVNTSKAVVVLSEQKIGALPEV